MRISGISCIVSLFEATDKSTFVHELGHATLANLKMLAEMGVRLHSSSETGRRSKNGLDTRTVKVSRENNMRSL